jgi:hypothetical protein
MSVADAGTVERADVAERFGQVIIVGGGCYGRYYVRQLQRAARAGAIAAERLIVVDRNVDCAVANEAAGDDHEPWLIPVELRTEDWREFFPRYLGSASEQRPFVAHDAIVPSPLMPHLMAEWLVARAHERWPWRTVETRPFDRRPDVPWERAAPDGTHYVSYATWMCPVNCVEPRTCPHTRGARDWSLATWLPDFARASHVASAERASVVLHCRHRAFGVGMFDTRDVLDADAVIREAGARGTADVFIGTVSHCHGALTRLVVGPPSGGDGSPVG